MELWFSLSVFQISKLNCRGILRPCRKLVSTLCMFPRRLEFDSGATFPTAGGTPRCRVPRIRLQNFCSFTDRDAPPSYDNQTKSGLSSSDPDRECGSLG